MNRWTVASMIIVLSVAAGCRESPAGPSTPSIRLSSSSQSFVAASGGPAPASQTVAITNGGGTGTLSDLAASLSYAAGQPTGWLSATLSGTTAPATLTVSAVTGSLAPGDYAATISITSGVADNSPQTIAVTFQVTGPDLVVTALTATISATDYLVRVTVTNQGTGDAIGAWTLRLITPPGGFIGIMDIPYSGQVLAAGADWTYSMRFIMSLPTGFIYDFTATADFANTIAESIESNNTMTIHVGW